MRTRIAAAAALAVLLTACSSSAAGTGVPASPVTATAAPTQAATSPAVTSAPSVAPSSAAPGTPDGEAFVDPEGEYRITVDPAWDAEHGTLAQGIEVWFTGPVVDNFRPNVNILTQSVGSMSLEQYTELSIENGPNFIADFALVESHTETGVNGTALAVLEYTGSAANDLPLRFLAVWTVADGTAIVATVTAPTDRFEEERDAALPYLRTLEPL